MSRLGSLGSGQPGRPDRKQATVSAPASAAAVLLLLCTDCRVKSEPEEDRGAAERWGDSTDGNAQSHLQINSGVYLFYGILIPLTSLQLQANSGHNYR